MGDVKPSLSNDVEVAREIYAALNRNDIPAVIKAFDPEIERIEPEGYPAAGTFRGHEELEAHLSQGRSTWAEGSCEPEQFLVAGDKVVVFLHVHVRLKDSTEWIEGHLADVLTFRNGKVIEMRTIDDQQEALDWAGAKASDAN